MLGEQRSSVFVDELVKQNYQLYITATASWSSPEFDRTAFSSIKDRVVTGKMLRRENPTDKRHTDSIVTDDFIEKITNRDVEKPFFGLLFLDAAHDYSRDSSAPEKFQPELEQVNYLELDNDYDATRFLNRYKNSVYYNDLLVGSIVETLKKQKILNNTVLIITSDHGQEFNENKKNYWGHNGNFSKYQTKIPLLIRWPNESTHVVKYRTSNEDIVPTLLTKSMGCSNSTSDYSTGQNLYSEHYQSKPLLFESWSRRALMTDDRIYVFEGYGGTQVYDHDYQQIENEAIGNKPLMEAMKMMGEFLH
jgi:membrane-anchored protein YejM (alkaline phosphatase superfamily)